MTHWLLTIPPAYRWAITAALVALVIGLSIAPGVARPGDSVFVWLAANTATPLQKAMHVVIYALLAVAWVWTLQSVGPKPLRYILAFVVTLGLGAILEWQQTRIPGRYGTLGDVLLNFIGIVLGLLGTLLLF